MKKFIFFSLTGLLVLGGSSAQAANFAVITSPPTAINAVILIAALVCIFSAGKVASLLKGGLLSKSWQIFIMSFVALAISELGILLSDFEIYALPTFVVPALLAIAVGLFMYGIFTTKQALE